MANDNWGQIVGNAVSTLGNYAVNAAANKRQFKFQQKAMAQQQQYNKELWDYQNAYNTPAAQMDRLKAAGLNPHLIYGQGSAGGGNAGPITPTEVPARQAARAGEIPNYFMQRLAIRQMDQQYEATKQKIEQSKVQSELMSTKTALENLRLMREGLRSKNYKDLTDAELQTAKFVGLRSTALYANEQSKGNLMDQMYNFRSQINPKAIDEKQLDVDFKKNRNELAKLGVYSSDNALLRILITAANRQGIDLGELLGMGMDKLKYLIELVK